MQSDKSTRDFLNLLFSGWFAELLLWAERLNNLWSIYCQITIKIGEALKDSSANKQTTWNWE